MQGNSEVIAYLNRYLTIELTGRNQYLSHAMRCGDWGLTKLRDSQHAYSLEEARHIERLTERILFLEGKPNLQDLKTVGVGETVEEQFDLDRNLISQALPLLREALGYCREQRDDVSRRLLEEAIRDEEEHMHWVETQLALLQRLGREKYLRAQL